MVVVNIPKVEVADISLPGRICPHNVTRTRACHHCAGATLELAAPPRRGAGSNDSGAQLVTWDDTYLIYSQDRCR